MFNLSIFRQSPVNYVVRTGCPWRLIPNDLPPWQMIYQQSQHWIKAGVFENMVHDLRAVLRLAQSKNEQPSATIFDGRTMQSTPESGERAGYDGYKRKKCSKVHIAVDTLGYLLAVKVTPANEQERAQVKELAVEVQEVTQQSVKVTFVDQGYSGDQPAEDAKASGIELVVIKLAEAKKGFVLLPKRWVVERSFAWVARFRRLARAFERTPEVLAGLHYLAFAILILQQFVKTIAHLL
jgi:transposase